MSGQLREQKTPHAGGMGMQLEENAIAPEGGKGIEAVVAVAEQACPARPGEPTGGLPEDLIAPTHGATAHGG